MQLTVGLAFIAGLVSFISPCVLPLVPAYIGYMGGRVANTVARTKAADTPSGIGLQKRFNTAVHGLFFVTGFTLVFVAIGLLSTAFIQQIGGANINLITDIIGRVGGIIIVFFGLHFMGIMPAGFARLRAYEAVLDPILSSLLIALLGSGFILWGFSGTLTLWDSTLWQTALWIPVMTVFLLTIFWLWLVLGGAFISPGKFWIKIISDLERVLYSDTRPQINTSGKQGYLSSALMGVVFSAGWTPCIGPVYGTVLTMAANGGDIREAGILLTAYSLGLGIPFLFTALMLDSMQTLLCRLQRHMRKIQLVSGAFLILIGITVASGQLQNLSQQFAGQFAEFSIELEQSVIGLVTGDKDAQGSTNQLISPTNSIESEAILIPTSTSSELNVGLEVGNIAPDFNTMLDTGAEITLSSLHGQIVLINFWATWCGPCRLEMPEFQQQFQRYSDRGFTIVAVNNGETLEDVIGFRGEFGLTFPLAMDEQGEIQDLYGIFSYPSTFVVNREGVIVARHFGSLTSQQISEMIEPLFAS